MIEAQRQQAFPGSDIVIEQRLDPGANYDRAVVSYRSEGLKIYALMTVPRGQKPAGGWPAVVFNHGYIPPRQYQTTERYVAYVNRLARSGYIVFKSDYRGHGNSEGEPRSYGYPDYTTDVLNAFASVKRYPDADANRIGMWGHSMGGYLTLRAMVISREIRAGVIWAGVVGSYAEVANMWFNRRPGTGGIPGDSRQWRETLYAEYGTPEENPAFWDAISATSYLTDLSGPLQLHHAATDTHVPVELSRQLSARVKATGGDVEYFEYANDDHNLSANFTQAMNRSIAFFDRAFNQTGQTG